MTTTMEDAGGENEPVTSVVEVLGDAVVAAAGVEASRLMAMASARGEGDRDQVRAGAGVQDVGGKLASVNVKTARGEGPQPPAGDRGARGHVNRHLTPGDRAGGNRAPGGRYADVGAAHDLVRATASDHQQGIVQLVDNTGVSGHG